MISIDYLSDLGLKGSGSSSSSTPSSNFNVVVDYVVDSTSSAIVTGDLLTFATNNVKKAGATDVINAIALESGGVGTTIECQIYGIITITNGFTSGMYYYNNGGALSTTESDEHIGFAISSNELLLKEGVFIA